MTATYELTDCPVCGSAESVEVADADSVAGEVAALWSYHTRRMAPTTDPRALADRLAFSQAPPLRVAQCTRCTHLFRNPRERAAAALYGGEELEESALDALFDVQRAAFDVQVRRLARMRDSITRGIEVGSYVGAFLVAAREHGWRFTGVDVNETAVRFARSRGCDAIAGTIEDVTGDGHDVVAFWNCFEQLDDPAAAARAARARLVDGGIMTVRVPNGAFWAALRPHIDGPASLVTRAALAQNNLLSFPYRNGFTEKSLTRLVEGCGFEVFRIFREFALPAGSTGHPWWTPLEARIVRALAQSLQPLAGAPWIELYARAL